MIVLSRKEIKMDCEKNCGYWRVDLDENGAPISSEYCHYIGPEEWAPCASEEWMNGYSKEWMNEERWIHEFGQPYNYEE